MLQNFDDCAISSIIVVLANVMHTLWLVILLANLLWFGRGALPLCKQYEDKLGCWQDVSTYYTQQAAGMQHFALSGPGEALKFSQIWLPYNCAYHRFTAKSLHAIVDRITHKTGNVVHLAFMGDSALRGVLCGITRILAGSEVNGPCINDICGLEHRHPRSFESEFQQFTVEFGHLMISFAYIKSLFDSRTKAFLQEIIQQHPYAVMFNTGAWDFDLDARIHRNFTATDECTTDSHKAISKKRWSPTMAQLYKDTGILAHELDVRVVYRTTHYNHRFGYQCADKRVLKWLHNTHWEVWDNGPMSRDVWQTQSEDGFHFDRYGTHTESDHIKEREEAAQNNKELPGMLEMQLAQSLLFNLFHDAVQECLDNNVNVV